MTERSVDIIYMCGDLIRGMNEEERTIMRVGWDEAFWALFINEYEKYN